MDQKTTVKHGKVTKLCWFVCAIAIVITVILIVSLLAVILYEVQNKEELCSEDINSRLPQQQTQQAMQILSVCDVACNVLSIEPPFRDPGLTSECVSCCQLTNATICNSQNDLTCTWVTVGMGGVCLQGFGGEE